MKKYLFLIIILLIAIGLGGYLFASLNLFSKSTKIKITYSPEFPSAQELKNQLEAFDQYTLVPPNLSRELVSNWCISAEEFKDYRSRVLNTEIKTITISDLPVYQTDNPLNWTSAKFKSFTNTGSNCGDRFLVPLAIIKNKLIWLPNTCGHPYDPNQPTVFSDCDQARQRLLDAY